METIDVELSEFTLRRRSLLLSHRATALPRGLEPGEHVVLCDAAHGFFTAHVADLGFEPADTVYRMRLGVRLTREEADERLRRAGGAPGRLTKQDLLDLLGQLRETAPMLPVAGRRCRRDTAL